MYAIYGNIYHQYTPNVSIPYMNPMAWSYGIHPTFLDKQIDDLFLPLSSPKRELVPW